MTQMSNHPAKVIQFTGADGKGFVLQMGEVWHLQSRKEEISSVNRVKAPELMRAMEDGFSKLAPMSAMVNSQLSKAEAMLKQRQSVVLLDVVPEYEKERGKMSADQRKALILVDPEVQRLQDVYDQLTALNRLLRDEMDGFRMAFSAVKKVYDGLSSYDGTNGQTESSAKKYVPYTYDETK
jgi:hypothetical protein